VQHFLEESLTSEVPNPAVRFVAFLLSAYMKYIRESIGFIPQILKFFFAQNMFLLSTYEIRKVLVSIAKKKNIANFHDLRLFIPKNEFRANFFFRLSRGLASVAVGFWKKFEAQLTQSFGYQPHLSQLSVPYTQNFEILKFL
jgi:hypothetical protein